MRRKIMKIIHTSDWHIGRSLYGRKRYEESEAFLDWLVKLISAENVDALLVAGDVFDNSTPSNQAQELYYRFLCRVAESSCRHVVITAGNHDSPSFLNAPREVLRYLNVHVIGSITGSAADEVLVLDDRQGEPALIVCAVPYLRDRDIRTSEAGESPADKEAKLLEGIRRHYQEVCLVAEQTRTRLNRVLPVAAMGHLFAAGGRTVEGDGVRSLYVGSLARVGNDVFPPLIDYLALGHLHIPQQVGRSDTRRYSGSPLPMGFGEAGQAKQVYEVDFDGSQPAVTALPVPSFQALERIQGDWETIARRLDELKASASPVWLEIIYEGNEIISDLRERLDQATAGTRLEILRARNNRVIQRVLNPEHSEETLDELDLNQVFTRCLDAHDVPEEQRASLQKTYQEVLTRLEQDDRQLSHSK
jgi:exonuclease SbcD